MRIVTFCSVFLLLVGCSTANFVNRGKVVPRQFYEEVGFTTQKNTILVPATLDGVTKNFLFDTGAQLSAVQRDTISGRIFTIRGASNRTTENGSETIKSCKIGTVDFVNIFANNGDFTGLKEQIPDFGGIIGRSIINKANWLIDYPNKKLTISDRALDDDSFQTLPLESRTGAPYTFITVNGREYRVIIDMGSSSTFNVPEASDLGQELLRTLPLRENTRDRYTVGGLEQITEQVGVVPVLTLGGMAFRDVATNINVSSQPRIGMGFFVDCIIYIDSSSGAYRIKRVP